MNKNSINCAKKDLEGIRTIALYHEKNGHRLECFIAPGYGANLVRFSVDGKNVIDFNPEILKNHRFTGTPVLYPKPNRVRGGRFTFEGRLFSYESPDKHSYEHGLVNYEKWDYLEPEAEKDAISLTLFLDCKKGSAMYEAFPISYRISLKYTLNAEGVKIRYNIQNQDGARLPYGFALHPYFIKLAGNDGTYAKLPAKNIWRSQASFCRQESFCPAEELDADILNGGRLGDMSFDHVFTEIVLGRQSEIRYDGVPFKLFLSAGPTFSHIVFFTPKIRNYFCIENQTCSTDAHNMFAKGYEKESGLEIIEPYGTREDFIFYRVEFLQKAKNADFVAKYAHICCVYHNIIKKTSISVMDIPAFLAGRQYTVRWFYA